VNKLTDQAALNALQQLFRTHFRANPERMTALPVAGSNRKYFRILYRDSSLIASYNPDLQDHRAFLLLADHFRSCKLPVPRVVASNSGDGTCLLQDLGDETLLNRIEKTRMQPGFEKNLYDLYKNVLTDLIRFQLDGDKNLDYRQLPVPGFDARSMRWDLNYFKYYFLKPAAVRFDENALEHDFDTLINYLSGETLHGFMYRDFQARNIMLYDDNLFYIDFQGGRKGPLQYDLVSLLFQVKAGISDHLREQLTGFYLLQLQKRRNIDDNEFKNRLKGFVLLRLLQVMGAYGFRGWFEQKPHFLESIPLLKTNLEWVSVNPALPGKLPEIERIIYEIKNKMEQNELAPQIQLYLFINSFSYRRGIPYDPSGHGGGYVFDCRLLPNPGRLEKFQELTGKDEPVILFFEHEPEVNSFVENAARLVKQTLDRYLNLGYERLQVNFGCTGGRHRSVYCAGKLAETLSSYKRVKIFLKHQELTNSHFDGKSKM